MPSPVSIKAAARELGRSVATVRRWVREGAPTVRLGEVGRGRGSLVEAEALRRWREGTPASPEGLTLATVAAALYDAYRRAPEGHSQPAWAELGLSHQQAAVLLVEAYREIARSVEGRYPDALPEEMARLASIVSRGKVAPARQ